MKARLIGTPERSIEAELPQWERLLPFGSLSGEVEFSDGKRYGFYWEIGSQLVTVRKTVTKHLRRSPFIRRDSVTVLIGKVRQQALLEALNEYEIYWASLDE